MQQHYMTNTTRLSIVIINTSIGNKHPPIAAPNLRCRPLRVVGMPVLRAIFRFAAVTPVARLHEKESPGIPVFVPRFLRLAIYGKSSLYANSVGILLAYRTAQLCRSAHP